MARRRVCLPRPKPCAKCSARAGFWRGPARARKPCGFNQAITGRLRPHRHRSGLMGARLAEGNEKAQERLRLKGWRDRPQFSLKLSFYYKLAHATPS